MLDLKINDFIHYCQVSRFSNKSIESLTGSLKQFSEFISSFALDSHRQISYSHLVEFVADFKAPSIHVKKARIWALHQFFHFLKLNGLIEVNIAVDLPYPKIEKTIPKYLTADEYNQILHYLYRRADSLQGLQDLVIVMFLGFLGLRISSSYFFKHR